MRENAETRIALRNKIWKEQDKKCYYCHKPLIWERAYLDHVIPVDKIEKQYEDNHVVTCRYCNVSKGNHIVFTNLFDKEVYVLIDVPYYFRYKDIIYNHKDKK